MGEGPNYFSTQFAIGNATTSADSLTFGFDARRLNVRNFESVDIYVRLTSTALGLASTTDCVVLSSGGTVDLTMDGLAGLSAYTTSTAGSNKLLRVVALR